jgi:hypothetical protein
VEQLPFNRMRPSHNQYLRDVAKEKNVYLADLEKALENISANNIPREDLFIDFCHMRWQGYYLMAREFLDLILSDKLIQGKAGEPVKKPTRDESREKEKWQGYLPMDPDM